jgi:electron transfer flavoprotein-quinone oxidoreductase
MADFDVIVVGSGCAGSVAAYLCAQADKSVLVVERGDYAGAKNMTGGRIYTHSLAKVFPDFAEEAPLERKITHEKISFIAPESNFTVDFTSPKLGLAGSESYSVLRAPFDQWLASKAEEAGAEYIYGIAVEDLLFEGNRVTGIRAGEDEITAEITILADGVNSLLSEKAGLAQTPNSHQMAVGVKETIELPAKVIEDRMCAAPGEGAAWLFVGDATHGHVGGGFLYANKESISLGLVATLADLTTSDVPIYQMLEDFKSHPAIAPVIAGGTTVEYSGHLIPEGGYDMIPTLYKDGCLLTGDAAMFCINLGYQVRGMDFAVTAGQLAAEAAIEALDKGDTSAAGLAVYKTKLDGSFVLQDLKAFRKFPHFMESTTRLFTEYPKMIEDIFLSMFVVDGKPVKPVMKKVMPAVKEVGMFKILGDLRGGMKAL